MVSIVRQHIRFHVPVFLEKAQHRGCSLGASHDTVTHTSAARTHTENIDLILLLAAQLRQPGRWSLVQIRFSVLFYYWFVI